MPKSRHFFVLLLGFLLARGLQAQTLVQTPDPRILPLAKEQVGMMEELARWCHRNGLFREKNRTLEVLLKFDQDHQYARRESGWQRLGKKKWVRVRGFRRPIRTNPEMKKQWKERSTALLNHYCSHLAVKLQGLKPPIHAMELRRLTESLLVLSPKHGGLRILLGERLVGRSWKLKESVPTKAYRKRLANHAKLLLDGAGEPATVPLTKPEKEAALRWTEAQLLPGVRVVGTVSKEEIKSSCQLARAAINYVRMSMRNSVEPFQGFTIYLLDSREEAKRFFHFYPGISDQNRRFAESLSSCWLSGSSKVVIWSESKKMRREWVARQTVAMLLRQGWNISTKNAALFEGFGLYLSHKLTGERSTWYVRPSRYGRQGSDRDEATILKKTKDWLRLARRRLRNTPPKYRRLLSLSVNQMVTDDLLDSYVFAAYLLEAAVDKREEFLRKIGEGKNFEHAVAEVWGMDVPALQERVKRWLKETKSR